MTHSVLHRVERQDRGSYGILSSVPKGMGVRVRVHGRDWKYPGIEQVSHELELFRKEKMSMKFLQV